MIDFIENLTKVGRSTLNSISPSRGKVQIRLVLKDGIKRLVFILTNVFYLFNKPSNLICLDFLNNARIYHHNKNQILYDLKIQKIFAFAE